VVPTSKPPILGRLLLRFCRLGDRRSDVEADLKDLFEKRAGAVGAAQARRRWGDASGPQRLRPVRRPAIPRARGTRSRTKAVQDSEEA